MVKFLKKVFLLFIGVSVLGGVVFMNYYFNTLYKGSLEIKTGGSGVSATLSGISTDFKDTKSCDIACTYLEIIPGDYKLELFSTGFEEYSKVISIKKGELTLISADLKPTTSLKKYEETTFKGDKKTELFNRKLLKGAHTYETFGEEIYYLLNRGNDLYFGKLKNKEKSEIKLGKANGRSAVIDRISQSSSEFFVKLPTGKNYIIDFTNQSFKSFNFKEKIKYIKKTGDNLYLIISEKGVFKYNSVENKFEFKDVFLDFIEEDGVYIGYISSEDKYSIKYKINGNYIVKYDTSTRKVSKIVPYYKEIFKIEKILGKIYITDVSGDKYTINNIKND